MAFPETGGGIVSCRKDIPFQILMRLMFSCWAAIPGKETVREGVRKPADGNERRETRIGFYLHEVQIKEDSVMRSRPGWLPERQAPQSILMDVVCWSRRWKKGCPKWRRGHGIAGGMPWDGRRRIYCFQERKEGRSWIRNVILHKKI